MFQKITAFYLYVKRDKGHNWVPCPHSESDLLKDFAFSWQPSRGPANVLNRHFGDTAVNSVDEMGGVFRSRPRTGVILLFIALSLVLSHIPILNLLVAPIMTFVTAVHELSHAIACLLTGGHVDAMTIVGDGQGHGGLTYTHGGIRLIITQAGYIGTALFGCLLIWLGHFPRLSKVVLLLIGIGFGIASLTFMFGTVLHGGLEQGVLSMLSGLFMAGVFIIVSLRSNYYIANLILLFLGVQTGLNSIDSITWLFNPGGTSDADTMAAMTGIPAMFWSVSWLLFAGASIGATLWWTVKMDRKNQPLNTI
jgi:hypothetical protein